MPPSFRTAKVAAEMDQTDTIRVAAQVDMMTPGEDVRTMTPAEMMDPLTTRAAPTMIPVEKVEEAVQARTIMRVEWADRPEEEIKAIR